MNPETEDLREKLTAIAEGELTDPAEVRAVFRDAKSVLDSFWELDKLYEKAADAFVLGVATSTTA